jgi:hypothetical protein
MRLRTIMGLLLAGLMAVPGCIIDDRGGARGQSNAPSASVPDSGGPVRRESPSKTLKDAEPVPPAGEDAGTTTVNEKDSQ